MYETSPVAHFDTSDSSASEQSVLLDTVSVGTLAAGGSGVGTPQRGRMLRPEVNKILGYDALMPLSTQEKQLIWAQRRHLEAFPDALPKILQSANMRKADHADYVHKYVLYD
jgi:hypothetical protein